MKPSKLFIVAELSCNHLGDFDRAMALVRAAKGAGADACKLQCFTVAGMTDNPDKVLESGQWMGRSLGDLYAQAMTPRSWFKPLFEYASSIGIEPFASVFTPDDVDFLEEIGCSRYKIASFELTDTDLIRYTAKTGKPVIISTGMATWMEIRKAAWAALDDGCKDLTLLKCTSAYPAKIEDANLATMVDMGNTTLAHVSVGLSDHTLGIVVPVAATALGASMIEKHLTLRRIDGGPDAAFSLEPEEFKEMVKQCRLAHDALGEVRYGPLESEKPQLSLRRPPGGKRG